tara:strand:- start:5421 stop:6224 length:804 start_codon:yes stop_codon:yes gene_type:complete
MYNQAKMKFPELEEIREKINLNGFFILKNLIPQEEYLEMRRETMTFFFKQNEIINSLPKALRGGISAGMPNVIGYSKNKNWNIIRSCFFTWNRNPNELRKTIEISRKVSAFRNKIIGLPSDYGSCIENDNYCQYTSLSLYPKDGGFLNKHTDGHKVDNEFNLLHFKIELTHKNKDYKNGGFYIWDKHNKRHCLSSAITAGDVLLFDGSLPHEIKPIDGDMGRIALFEIPTYVTKKSRCQSYTDINESKNIISKLKSKIYNFKESLKK